MATPPTFVAEYESAWNSTTSPKNVSVTTAVGDVLVLIALTANHNASVSTPTGGTSLTWTLQQSVAATNYGDAYLWTATATTAETFTCSVTKSGADNWGWICLRFSGSDGVGASSSTNVSSGAPSLGLTTTGDNSAIALGTVDWNAVDGTSRTWRSVNGSAATEQAYFRDSSQYTIYAGRHADAGTAGAKTVGLSAPSGQKYSIVAVEILGAAASGTTHALASTGTGTSTGSLAVSLVQKTSSTGTGSSTGSVNLLLAPGAISATGTGTSTGSVNVNLAPGALSATGTGQTAGSAALSLNAALTASGTGQTAGSVDVTLDAAPLALSATGSSSSTGSLAVDLQLSCSSTGTGTSAGTLDLTIVGGPLSLSATGTGQTAGSAALTATLALGSTGSGSSTGSVALISTLQVAASGAGTTTGSADTKLVLGLSATGTGQTAGSLDVTIPFGNTYALSGTGTGTTAGSLELTPLLALSASAASQTTGSAVLIRTGQLRGMGLGGQTSGSLVLNLRAKLTASGSAQTAGSMAMRISLHRLSATGYTFSDGSLDLSEPLFRFSMPTHEEPIKVDPNRIHRPLAYYRLTYAPSLVKVGGQWTTFRTPPPELLEGLTAGEDYFLGGFEYEISQQLARELALAGYTATPI